MNTLKTFALAAAALLYSSCQKEADHAQEPKISDNEVELAAREAGFYKISENARIQSATNPIYPYGPAFPLFSFAKDTVVMTVDAWQYNESSEPASSGFNHVLLDPTGPEQKAIDSYNSVHPNDRKTAFFTLPKNQAQGGELNLDVIAPPVDYETKVKDVTGFNMDDKKAVNWNEKNARNMEVYYSRTDKKPLLAGYTTLPIKRWPPLPPLAITIPVSAKVLKVEQSGDYHRQMIIDKNVDIGDGKLHSFKANASDFPGGFGNNSVVVPKNQKNTIYGLMTY